MTNNTFNPQKEFFIVLHKIGQIANVMISPGPSTINNSFEQPLMLRWGYVEDLQKNNDFFVNATNSFNSSIKWALHDSIRHNKIFPNGFVRWWLFYPARIDEIANEKSCTIEVARQWLHDNDPNFGIESNKEFVKFVMHLSKCYSKYENSLK
jgi:hypothetical protein